MSATIVNVNLLIKEAIANMPDTLNTKKEIDEYYKVAMKEISEKLKEEKKANKETKTKDKAAPKKRVKKAAKAKPVEVDDDGNEIVKVKKPLNNYQKFIQEQRPKVKEDYPELSGEEIFKKIAELWKQHKEDINNGDGEPKKDSDVKSDSDDEAAKAAEAAEAYINSEEDEDEAAEAAKADVKTTVVVEEKKEKAKERKEKKPKKEIS